MTNLKQLATIIYRLSLIFICISTCTSLSAQGITDMGVVWEKTYGTGIINNIKPFKSKNGYVACGQAGARDGLIVEIDEDGKQLSRTVVSVTGAYPAARTKATARFIIAFKTDDGGILAFGHIHDPGAPQAEKAPDWYGLGSLAASPFLNQGIWIVKLDASKKIVSQKREWGLQITDGWQTSDGNFVVAGFDRQFSLTNPPNNDMNGITLLRKYNQSGALVKDARNVNDATYNKRYREINSFYQYPGTNNFVAATPDHILKIDGNTVKITSGTKMTGTLLPGVTGPYGESISPSKDGGLFILSRLNSVSNQQQNFTNGVGFYKLSSSNAFVYNNLQKPSKLRYQAPLLLPSGGAYPQYVGTLEKRTAYNSTPQYVLYQLTDNGKFNVIEGTQLPAGTSLKAVSTSDGFFSTGTTNVATPTSGLAKIAKLSTCVNFKISNPPTNNKYIKPFTQTLVINEPINYIGSKATNRTDVQYSLTARVVEGTVNNKTAGQVLETLTKETVATLTASGGKASGKAFDLNRTYNVTSDKATIGYTIVIHDNYTLSGIKQQCDQSYYFTLETSLVGGTTTGKTAVCYNTSAGNLSVTNGGGGVGTTTYQWQSQVGTAAWANIAGATAVTYTTPNLTTTTKYRRAITNTSGTKYSSEFTVNVYAQVVTAATQVNVTCNGQANGSINTTGGAKYRIMKAGTWGAWVTSGAFTGLTAGTYKVQAQNAQACLGNEVTINITQPAVLNLALTSSNVTTPNGSDGKITLTVSGGTAPYQYSTNGTTFTAMTSPLTLSNYKKGSYTIYIKDKNGCTANKQIEVVENLVGGTTTGSSNVCYNTSAGSLSVTNGGGGVGTTTYQWQSQVGTAAWANIAGATAVTYTTPNLTTTTKYRRAITNTSGTKYSSEFTVNVYAQVVTAATQVNVTCNGQANGSINTTGGAKYRIMKAGTWGAWVASGAFTGLTAGTYKVQAQNAQACLGNEVTINITQPAVLSFTTNVKNISCGQVNNGSVDIVISGGTAPYQYSKDGTSYTTFSGTSTTVGGYTSGNHTLYIKDAKGCTDSKQISISKISLPIGDVVAMPTFSIDDTGTLKIETSVKNIGTVPFAKPLTITVYKNTLGNSTKQVFTNGQAIAVSQTIDLELSIPNFKTDSKWSGCSSIVIHFNDKGDGLRDQDVCDENKIREYKLKL